MMLKSKTLLTSLCRSMNKMLKFHPISYGTQCNGEKNHLTKMTDKDWKNQLSAEQYYVCRQKGTEVPFSGEFCSHKEPGTYQCICCGVNLFSSEAKFDSGCGWPSFYDAWESSGGEESKTNIATQTDSSAGMIRTEILCAKCGSHLGHVFPDGPPPTGTRYCVNSVSLKFLPKTPQNGS